jgi:hypothetical protein
MDTTIPHGFVRSNQYYHEGGYKRQCELAGIEYSTNPTELMRQATALGTYKAFRALRAVFQAWYYVNKSKIDGIRAKQMEIMARQIMHEGR